ncbi:MAG: hypothetical protein WC459_01150 [Patescibacteria group bacterium]
MDEELQGAQATPTDDAAQTPATPAEESAPASQEAAATNEGSSENASPEQAA